MKDPNPFSLSRCDGLNRRDFLQLGLLSGFGLSLPGFLRLQAHAQSSQAAKAQSCILIWLDGGPSHIDTFDPKPDAPSEIRSPFAPISTDVSGLQICEHLPLTARVMKQVALIRSLTHELGNHDTGATFLLTGHRPTPVMQHPSLGSLLASEFGFDRPLPPYIAIPDSRNGSAGNAAQSGFLSESFAPFNLGEDPSKVRNLHPPEGVRWDRVERRRSLVRELDDFSRRVETSAATQSRDSFYEQAYRLMASTEAKNALQVGQESAKMRERYGHSRIGTSCLLARRLVEAGSRFVSVVDIGWDTHSQIAKELPDSRFAGSGKLPALDRAYAALITDLKERGLLENTLVVLMGEFGRTPKINSLGGRDHWPRASFACLAGGGVQGGRVIGSTNSFGEVPVDRPVTPPDLVFSILQLLGVNPGKTLHLPNGRPMKIMSEGSFIQELV